METKYCTNCGKAILPGEFRNANGQCGECAAKAQGAARTGNAMQYSEKDWLVTLLFSIFLGCLGSDLSFQLLLFGFHLFAGSLLGGQLVAEFIDLGFQVGNPGVVSGQVTFIGSHQSTGAGGVGVGFLGGMGDRYLRSHGGYSKADASGQHQVFLEQFHA